MKELSESSLRLGVESEPKGVVGDEVAGALPVFGTAVFFILPEYPCTLLLCRLSVDPSPYAALHSLHFLFLSFKLK